MTHGIFFCDSYMTCGAGHLGVNYDRVLKMGYGAIRKEIEEKKAALDLSNPDDIQKDVFYQAALISNQAATDLIRRHAEALKEKAAKEADETRKAELLKMAANCDWIATEPPRTFWEALQAVEFVNMMVLLDLTDILFLTDVLTSICIHSTNMIWRQAKQPESSARS